MIDMTIRAYRKEVNVVLEPGESFSDGIHVLDFNGGIAISGGVSVFQTGGGTDVRFSSTVVPHSSSSSTGSPVTPTSFNVNVKNIGTVDITVGNLYIVIDE